MRKSLDCHFSKYKIGLGDTILALQRYIRRTLWMVHRFQLHTSLTLIWSDEPLQYDIQWHIMHEYVTYIRGVKLKKSMNINRLIIPFLFQGSYRCLHWKFTKLFAQMWHKAIWKGHPMRLELTRVGLLVELANHYTTRGALPLPALPNISFLPKLVYYIKNLIIFN